MKNMRRILFCVALVATSIILTSCSKEKTIIGSWTLTVVTQSNSDIEVLTGGIIWTFYEDSKYDDYRIGYPDGSVESGDWSIYGNRLNLSFIHYKDHLGDKYSREDRCYNILSLNNKEMSLCAEDGDILDFVKTK